MEKLHLDAEELISAWKNSTAKPHHFRFVFDDDTPDTPPSLIEIGQQHKKWIDLRARIEPMLPTTRKILVYDEHNNLITMHDREAMIRAAAEEGSERKSGSQSSYTQEKITHERTEVEVLFNALIGGQREFLTPLTEAYKGLMEQQNEWLSINISMIQTMFDSLTQRMVTLEDSHREILSEFKGLMESKVQAEAAAQLAEQGADPLQAVANMAMPQILAGMSNPRTRAATQAIPRTAPAPTPTPPAQPPSEHSPSGLGDLADIFGAIADDADTLDAGMKVLSKLKEKGFDFGGLDTTDIPGDNPTTGE